MLGSLPAHHLGLPCPTQFSVYPPANIYLMGPPNQPWVLGSDVEALCDVSLLYASVAPSSAPTLPRLPGPVAATSRAGP